MIDRNTGTIRPENCTGTLYFGLTEQEFVESALGRQASVEMQNPPYSTYRVPLLTFYNRAWATQLFFCYGILQLCSMALTYGNGWSDYSIEIEYAQLKEYEDILMREVGAISYSAGWGHIGAYFSEKTGGSSIVVSYNVLLLIDW